MKKDEKLVLWTERLKAFQASGQTCKEWCQEHQIPVSTMTYWNRKLRAMENSSQPELIFAKMPTEQELSARDTMNGSSALKEYSGVRPHKEKINISKEIINKTGGAEAPYAAQIFIHLSVVSSRQR